MFPVGSFFFSQSIIIILGVQEGRAVTRAS